MTSQALRGSGITARKNNRSRALQVKAMAGTGRFFVGGNWKCNGTVESVNQLVKDLNSGSIPSDVDVVIAPTFVHLETISLWRIGDVVGTKVEYALSQGLKVIGCIGETLEERESGEMFNVLNEQLEPIVKAVDDWSNVVIAYEPVWAIGTGVVATPDQAQEAHAFVRSWLSDHIGKDTAEERTNPLRRISQ
eukprot:jgi/Picre1/27890/NNA_000853.t1